MYLYMKTDQDGTSDVIIKKVYLRNRKRVACIYGVIMHAGNVRRILEKHVNMIIQFPLHVKIA